MTDVGDTGKTMTEVNARKKEYLLRYQTLLRIEQEIQEELLDTMLAQALPRAIRYDGDGGGPGKPRDLSDFAAKVDQLQTKLIKAKDRAVSARLEITSRIDAMQDDTEKLLLRLRYIRGMTFDEVADAMGYSWRHVIRIHGSALQHFKL